MGGGRAVGKQGVNERKLNKKVRDKLWVNQGQLTKGNS